MSRQQIIEDIKRARRAYRTPEHLRGVPCRVCGSTRSVRGYLLGYGPNSANPEAVCEPNLDGRDRCREREVAQMLGQR